MDGGAEGLPLHPPFRLEVLGLYSTVKSLFIHRRLLGLSQSAVRLIG